MTGPDRQASPKGTQPSRTRGTPPTRQGRDPWPNVRGGRSPHIDTHFAFFGTSRIVSLMGATLRYTVRPDTLEATLMAALLAAVPRSLRLHDGVPRALRHGNYFLLGELWLLVRTSRLARPFWGLRRRVVLDFLDAPFALVLLTAPLAGWALDREQVLAHMAQGRWSLARDQEYKITPPLPEACRFQGLKALRRRLDRAAPGDRPTPPDPIRPRATVGLTRVF